MSDCFVLYLLLTCMKKKTSGADKFTNNNKDSVVFRKGDRRIFSVSEKHLRNLRKPAKTVGMRMEVCYNITCIWLRIWMKS